MAIPKKLEAHWSIHGMGFGISRSELEELLNGTGKYSPQSIEALWKVFHCARKGSNGNESSGPFDVSQNEVIDAVGFIVTYYLLSNASTHAKISAVFNFMDFNNRSWISGSELTILLMSLAYTLEDIAKNVEGSVPSSPSRSQTPNRPVLTTHDESDTFIEDLLAANPNERMSDGDHRVDYPVFFDGVQRLLGLSESEQTPGVTVISRILNALDPSQEEVIISLIPFSSCLCLFFTVCINLPDVGQ